MSALLRYSGKTTNPKSGPPKGNSCDRRHVNILGAHAIGDITAGQRVAIGPYPPREQVNSINVSEHVRYPWEMVNPVIGVPEEGRHAFRKLAALRTERRSTTLRTEVLHRSARPRRPLRRTRTVLRPLLRNRGRITALRRPITSRRRPMSGTGRLRETTRRTGGRWAVTGRRRSEPLRGALRLLRVVVAPQCRDQQEHRTDATHDQAEPGLPLLRPREQPELHVREVQHRRAEPEKGQHGTQTKHVGPLGRNEFGEP